VRQRRLVEHLAADGRDDGRIMMASTTPPAKMDAGMIRLVEKMGIQPRTFAIPFWIDERWLRTMYAPQSP
jgi:hypothetical protein